MTSPAPSGDRRHLDLLSLLDGPRAEDRLLVGTAEMMRRWAEQHCKPVGTGPAGGCRPYHAWWQYWRLVGLVATPDWHSEAYAEAFRSHREGRAFRVLVCGAADYGILGHLVRAMPPGMRRDVSITVLDLCRTPLEMCAWYAARLPADSAPRMSFQRGDILSPPFRDGVFDLITTYSFLTRFPDPLKARIVEEWGRKLRPGGSVVTTCRLGRPARPAKLGPDELARLVIETVIRDDPRLEPMSDILGRLAADYARTVTSHPLPSVEHTRSLFGAFTCAVGTRQLASRFGDDRGYALIAATRR